ncbi:MAG: TolC family protein [Desulfobacterales bacterium]|nr:TolC family protein [Desulfobacterales bacterium]
MQQVFSKICLSLCMGIFLLCSSALNSFGQFPSSTPLTLTEAIQNAVAKNPKISAAGFQVESSDAQITQARSGLLPQIYFSEGYNHTTNPMWAFGTKLNQEQITRQDFDPARLNDPDPINNFASTLSLNWSLYDSGQTRHGLKQAEIGKKMTTLMLERTRQQVIAQTVAAYVGVLLAQKNLAVIEQTLETARAHHKMVRARFENGFVVKSDLLRAQVHIADLEQQQLQAESQVQVARAYLNAAMGAPIESIFDLSSPLEAGQEVYSSLESWMEKALSLRPELKQMQNQEMIAQEEINKSKAAHLPSINLMGNYEFNTEDFSEWGDNYTVGAMVNLNIFSGRRLSARTVQARAALNEVGARQADLKLGILVQTRQAFLQAQSARKRIPVAAAAVTQAEETLRIVRNRYETGLLNIVALLDAELTLQHARTNQFKAAHDYKVAAVQLALVAGTIDENFQ